MGTGSSKVVIKRVAKVDYSAVNAALSDEKDDTNDVNKQLEQNANIEAQKDPKEISENDSNQKRNEIISSPQPEEPQTIEVKPVSKTLNATKEKLKTKGFTDEVLATHCDESPAHFDDFVKLYEHVQKIKKNIQDDDFVSLTTTSVKKISSLYEKERSEKIKKGNMLAEIGFPEVFRDLYDKLIATFPKLLTYDREEDEEHKDDESLKPLLKAQDLLGSYLVVTINYTDFCDNLNVAFGNADLISRFVDMVDKVKDCTPYHVKYMDINGSISKKYQRGNFLSRGLGTLHNLSKRVQTRPKFAECDAVKILLPITEDKVTIFATKALLILAYLIDESNNELIMANKGPIKFLILGIDKAITKSSSHRYLGFSSAELAEGLAQMAINDTNKKTIVNNNALPIIKKMIEKALRDEETIEAVELLWVLAFDEDNRDKMKKTDGLVDLLKTLKDSDNDMITKAVSGALWEIEGKQGLDSSAEMKHSDKSKHVMISYQWDVQKTLIQVRKRLMTAGYKVWMDLEQMGGSTLEAMARAVENSAVVLVCVSQKYKESSNCRSEAEYAFQLKKDIVPLMMENNYRPDGWLGMIMGSKLWIDFAQGQRKMDTSVRDLVKELGARGKAGSEDLVEAVNVDTVDAVLEERTKVDISGWKNKEVMDWISSFGLEVKKKNSLKKLNGPFLTRLHALRNESPDYYYTSLRDDVGIYDVYSILSFTDELEKLIG
ncbi:uncharacterized protein LOC110253730 [Exaiptasia diaphana]|uniref:TIR domain-containing protein n=1 Tax=Exaiptasia diaphana TaxID=2652724 RepID=A0A913Y8D1_EXADI|nr:uncharacterized protein LOC110253730 [Exaiptasia diaphana]KXJ21747.1 hypothetical protein AC249_AIPGENE15161 [Exaiptasia diaphana]